MKETLSKKKKTGGTGGMVQVVQVPSKCKALNSISRSIKKKRCG
jgi:hypothetical protein